MISDAPIQLPTDKLAIDNGCVYDKRYPANLIRFSQDVLGVDPNPFQRIAIEQIYGWRRADKSKLRWRTCNIFTPKKQGKSFLLSLLAIATAYAKPEQKIYIIASTEDEGKTIFDECRRLIGHSLRGRYQVRESKGYIVDTQTKSEIHLLSGSPSGKSGKNADLFIAEEIAFWQPAWADKVWDKFKDSTMAKDGLIVTISTAGWNREHLGYRIYSAANAIKKGESPVWTTCPIIYEVPEDQDWTDEANWKQALPSLNYTVSLEYYRDAFSMLGDDVHAQSIFRCHLLSQWCGSPQGWLSPVLWTNCASDVPESKHYGKPAVIGVDAARTSDNCVYSVIVEDDGIFYVYPRWFLPSDLTTKKTEEDHFDYRAYAGKTNIVFTPGNVVDMSYLRKSIEEDRQKFNLQAVYYDDRGMEESRQLIQESGLLCVQVVQQPRYLAPAIAKLEVLLKTSKLRHPRCPILNWNFENCVPILDRDDRVERLVKASRIQRIDGIDSIVTGLCFWLDDRKPDATVCPKGESWFSVW